MRAKEQNQDENSFGSDSFLDIVANMVGIMIILVVVVGVRAQNYARNKVDDNVVAARDELAQLQRQGDELEVATRALATEIEEVAMAAAGQQQQRDLLAYRVARDKHLLEQRQTVLGEQARKDAELRQQVAARRTELERLENDLLHLASAGDAPPIEIQSFPTPISQTVYGEELHYQLRDGRVTFIPMDDLIAQFRSEARHKLDQLKHLPEFSDLVGPIGGFRMKYTMQRVDVARETADPRIKQVGSYAQLSQFTLIPVASTLGESLEEALAGRSEFRASLVDASPRSTTVTLWVYPECFSMYRRLKQELYQQGFAVAGRPLPSGQPIGGSPSGSKSAAQ